MAYLRRKDIRNVNQGLLSSHVHITRLVPFLLTGPRRYNDHVGILLRCPSYESSYPEEILGMRQELQTSPPLSIFNLSFMSHANIFDHPAVKEIIYARRFETITLHRILQGFSTSECDWLMPPGPQLRVSVSDAQKRRELLEEFLFWYFDGFIFPLLKVSIMIERRLKF